MLSMSSSACSSRQVWNVSGPACGKFNKPRDETRPHKGGIVPVSITGVRGKLDPDRPTELKGSHVFEREDVFYNAIRTATLSEATVMK
jgi:hypothetical protein